MIDQSTGEFSRILDRARQDGSSAEELTQQLYPPVYQHLRAIAGRLMRNQPAHHTLCPTDLVHEAYAKLAGGTPINWQNRAHFLAVAATAMRQILLDHARRRMSSKRGGKWLRVSLTSVRIADDSPDQDLIALHEALNQLAEKSARMAKLVELRVFAGMTAREAAHVLGVSRRTADSDWKVARLLLAKAMQD